MIMLRRARREGNGPQSAARMGATRYAALNVAGSRSEQALKELLDSAANIRCRGASKSRSLRGLIRFKAF